LKTLQWAVLILSLIINSIVLLNLLVAIVGDVYNRVMSLSVQYKYKERAVAIAEV
jgi:hypothetical protein